MADRTCTVLDCSRPFYGRGWCEPHYARWRRHGDLTDQRSARLDPADRFWPKVNKTTGGCWLWTASINNSGYGSFKMDGRSMGAHVASWLLSGKAIPAGLEIDHRCRVRHCVRPDHLRLATRRENIATSSAPSVLNGQKTHCKRGHEFTPENTYVNAYGRKCRACAAAYQRELRLRRKALAETA
jgi:hypothetical protein